MSNTVVDFESAPVPASAIPTNNVSKQQKQDEKDLDIFNGERDITIAGADSLDHADEAEPTDEEYRTLRKVPAPMKWAAVAMCFIELAERASYYGCTKIWNNYMKNPLPKGGNGAGAVAPGAMGLNQVTGGLGMGSVSASAVTSSFNFLTYTIPILGGILADTKWGRFKTILIGTIIGFFAHVLLCVAVVPSIISTGNGFAPFIISLLILAFAAGLIKPSLGPLLCDQSPVKRPTLITTKKGERVVLDPQATVSRYLNVFYMCINIGAFMALGTAYAARYVGFWVAFLIPGIVYLLMPILMFFCYKHLYKAPPQGSVVLESLKVLKTVIGKGGILAAFKGGDDFWNRAKPSYIEAQEGSVDRTQIFWDDTFVDEIKQSIRACGVFFLIPIFNLSDGGIGISETAMSNAMVLNGIPSEIYSNANPLTIIIASPIFIFGIYPLCNKLGHTPRPTLKLMAGFLLGSANMIIGAIVQWKIYTSSPCGYYASSCKAGVSNVNLAWQLPLYILPALGEILINVTSYELAYTRAPARMKGLVYAICLFSQAISYAIQLAMSKVVDDPWLIWPYVALAVACFLAAFVFPTYFRHLDEPMRNFADVDRQFGKQQPDYQAKAEALEEGETADTRTKH